MYGCTRAYAPLADRNLKATDTVSKEGREQGTLSLPPSPPIAPHSQYMRSRRERESEQEWGMPARVARAHCGYKGWAWVAKVRHFSGYHKESWTKRYQIGQLIGWSFQLNNFKPWLSTYAIASAHLSKPCTHSIMYYVTFS